MKRFDFFVGGILGIIGIGIITLVALILLHYQSFSIKIDDLKAIEILLPPVVTVIGWIIAIKLAITQLEVSHRNNRKVQYEIAENTDRLTLMKEMATQIKDISLILHNLSISIYSLKDATKKSRKENDIKHHMITAQKLKDDLLNKWHEIYIQNELLLFHDVNIDIEKLKNFIVNDFYGEECAWIELQESVRKHLYEEENLSEKIISCSSRIFDETFNTFKECIDLIKTPSSKKKIFRVNIN